MSIKELPDGVVITVKVQPRSSRNRIVKDTSDSIKAYLNAPPVDGAANHACLALLSELLRVPKSNVLLVSGYKSRTKAIKILGVSAKQFLASIEVNVDKN
ncbi:hypothetical protein AXX12_03610 [Anaerosporomusa subterranea]|uniref:UPF0235 protein AXX12_03610 n=1 Tax=Anaerosporomusa subterranea TaxID=1794912 RepID=A0A154BTI4_ANASB|nr:DUF167 domain-containing protein [Anaerosporomusa subterranea]KYZ77231.1 hypothetical protein AXX12_03610 [Anaerosporomusa subterranea]